MDEKTKRLHADLDRAECRAKRTCQQVMILNKHLQELQARYDRAERDGNKPFCDSLRLKITTTEGIRNIYNLYVEKQNFLVKTLMYELFSPDPSEAYEPDIDYFSYDEDCIESSDDEPINMSSDDDDDDDDDDSDDD